MHYLNTRYRRVVNPSPGLYGCRSSLPARARGISRRASQLFGELRGRSVARAGWQSSEGGDSANTAAPGILLRLHVSPRGRDLVSSRKRRLSREQAESALTESVTGPVINIHPLEGARNMCAAPRAMIYATLGVRSLLFLPL